MELINDNVANLNKKKLYQKHPEMGAFFMPGINMRAHVQMDEMDMRAHVHSVK